MARTDGKQALAVDMGGDIEIGAVEIKDGVTDSRAAVTISNQLTVVDNVANSLVPNSYDYVGLTYTGANLTTAVFKKGGSGGTVVSTLALVYTGTTTSYLVSVTKV